MQLELFTKASWKLPIVLHILQIITSFETFQYFDYVFTTELCKQFVI